MEKQLNQTTSRRDTLYSREIAYSDSVSNIDQQMLKLQTESEVSAEVGPIKYVAQRVNQSVDTVVNWFIMLFIFVFDPLAVMLLIAANRLFETKDPLSEVIPEVVEEESQAERVKAPTPPASTQPEQHKRVIRS